MFVQVVAFSLEGISEDEYLDVAVNIAPRFAALPGLLAKVWLENPGGNRYGAVYFWEDVESMERFGDSDLFEGETAEFTDFVSEEFHVLENLTAQSQPVLEILQGRGPAGVAPQLAPNAGPAKKAAAGLGLAGPAKRTPPPSRSAPSAKKAAKRSGTVTKAATKAAPGKKAPGKKAASKAAPGKAAGGNAPASAAVAKKAVGKARPAKKAARKAAR